MTTEQGQRVERLLSVFDHDNGSRLPTRIQSVKMFFCVEANSEWKPGTNSTDYT